jgi:amino acid transporter
MRKTKAPPAMKEEYIDEDSTSHLGEQTTHGGHGGHGGVDEHGNRPRNLGVLEALFHLDADWGTSLAYILPLGLALTGRLAPIYMVIIAFIMFVVANGYKVVCHHNPDGGGVYSSLKKVNKFLAVVGALLLITDYVVTEALSVSDAYHYLHLDTVIPAGWAHVLPSFLTWGSIWTILIITLLTAINWRGPHFSAKFAGIASSSTFFLAGLLAVLALPLVPAGLANIGHFNQSIWDVLRNTTGVLLALSGVEAISNMTGIMKDPEKTSRRAINLELVKVVFTTVVLGIAMNGLPQNVVYHGQMADGHFAIQSEEREITDLPCVINTVKAKIAGSSFECAKRTENVAREDMLVAIGEYLVPGTLGKVYGWAIGVAYGLLLIFAGNTALIDITNVTYALARDSELPKGYTKLNKKYGVPVWGLFTAGIMPIVTVLVVGSSIEALAALYAIGVVGAVTMNLAGTTLQVKGFERLITGFGAFIMSFLFVTLVVTKMEATLFASVVLVLGLTARALQKKFAGKGREMHSGELDLATTK